jgi:hypothetical protein
MQSDSLANLWIYLLVSIIIILTSALLWGPLRRRVREGAVARRLFGSADRAYMPRAESAPPGRPSISIVFEPDPESLSPNKLTRQIDGLMSLMWISYLHTLDDEERDGERKRSRLPESSFDLIEKADEFTSLLRIERLSYNSPLEIFLYIEAGRAAVSTLFATGVGAYYAILRLRVATARAKYEIRGWDGLRNGLPEAVRDSKESAEHLRKALEVTGEISQIRPAIEFVKSAPELEQLQASKN